LGRNVTGVQTCALPILGLKLTAAETGAAKVTAMRSTERNIANFFMGNHPFRFFPIYSISAWHTARTRYLRWELPAKQVDNTSTLSSMETVTPLFNWAPISRTSDRK